MLHLKEYNVQLIPFEQCKEIDGGNPVSILLLANFLFDNDDTSGATADEAGGGASASAG